MELFEKIKQATPQQILKYALGFLALVVVLYIVSGMSSARRGGMSVSVDEGYSAPSAPMYDTMARDMSYGTKLSTRNIGAPEMMPQYGGYTPGNDGEAYEVKDYYARIASRDISETCGIVRDLKKRTDVIFERMNDYDQGCTYTFKAEQKSVEEIYNKIKDLNPKDLTENAYTIKRQVEDYTSQVDILKKKLTSIDETLLKATSAYDEVIVLATKNSDVESLAKIIDSKINIIERLTVERINIASQIESLERAKSEELDRLLYTFFTVEVYQDVVVDGEAIRDSWKSAVQQSFYESNRIIEELTVGLLTLALRVIQYVLYAVLLLVVAKFLFIFARKFWSV